MTYRLAKMFFIVVLPGISLLAGCSGGNKSFNLKGTVSYQGKPLTAGIVRLHMADNRQAMAMIQKDGSFEATDVFPGEAKVTVEDDPGKKQRMMMPPPPGAPKPPDSSSAADASIAIPAKYKDVATSGLSFPLKAGQPPLNIELQ